MQATATMWYHCMQACGKESQQTLSVLLNYGNADMHVGVYVT